MEEDILKIRDELKKQEAISHKPKYIKYLHNLISRGLLALILILGSLIYIKPSSSHMLLYKQYVFTNNWSFTKVNKIYQKYFGKVLPFEKIVEENTAQVFNEKLVFKDKKPFEKGVSLKVGSSYMVPSLSSGLVVFIGDKETYGKTVIIQGMDGIDVWYANINVADLKLYDYIVKGSLIGETINEELYLVFQKNGSYLTYEEYTQ